MFNLLSLLSIPSLERYLLINIVFKMKFIPKYYKTTPLSLVLKLETVTDKKGNICHVVTTCTGEKENNHYFFSNFSSALDFINSNFG